MAIARFLESYVFGPSGFWNMAPLRYNAKFDPFLSLDCARVEGMGAQSRERKGSNFAAKRSGAIVQKSEGPHTYDSKNLAIAIWQPCLPCHSGHASKAP